MPNLPTPRAFGVLIALALLPGLALCSRASHAPPQDLAAADRLFKEKSYAGALKIYERVLKAGGVPAARRDEVEYRIAVSLGKSQQWDRAMERSLAFVKGHRGGAPSGPWEPRALYWLGRLYLSVPHQGYCVGKRFYRGDNVPQTSAAEKPEAVDVSDQDFQNARDAFEAASVFYPAHRTASHTEGEEIQLDFDLARILSARDLSAWANLAVLLHLQGRRAERDALLERMAAANPGPVAAGVALRTLEALGDRGRASRWRTRGSAAGTPR